MHPKFSFEGPGGGICPILPPHPLRPLVIYSVAPPKFLSPLPRSPPLVIFLSEILLQMLCVASEIDTALTPAYCGHFHLMFVWDWVHFHLMCV